MSVCAQSARVAAASFILAAGFSASPSVPAASKTWRVVNIEASGRVHMRKRASNRSKILAYIPGDTRGLVSRTCIANWCEIEFRGLKGWVFRRYLEPDDAPTTAATPAEDRPPAAADRRLETLAQRKALRIINTDGRPIPVYAFPNEALPVAGHLPAETQSVEGLGSCIRDWCYVRSGALIGWLRTELFALDENERGAESTATLGPALERQDAGTLNQLPTTSTSAAVENAAIAAPAADPGDKLYALAGLSGEESLPIRERPEQDARILASIPADANDVEGLRKCVEKWCRVRWENTSGWVARRHLADPSIEGSQTFQVAGLPLWSSLEVVDYPGEKASVVAKIPSYARGIVPIGTCDKSWCQIRYLGIAGWVRAANLEPQKR